MSERKRVVTRPTVPARRPKAAPTDAERVRESVLDEAVRAGKFGADRRHVYRAKWDTDPAGTRALIAQLAPVPLPEDESQAEDDAYPAGWLPEVGLPAATPAAPTAVPAPTAPAYPVHWLPEVGRTGEGRIIIGGD